jgi:hypothetical protein
LADSPSTGFLPVRILTTLIEDESFVIDNDRHDCDGGGHNHERDDKHTVNQHRHHSAARQSPHSMSERIPRTNHRSMEPQVHARSRSLPICGQPDRHRALGNIRLMFHPPHSAGEDSRDVYPLCIVRRFVLPSSIALKVCSNRNTHGFSFGLHEQSRSLV